MWCHGVHVLVDGSGRFFRNRKSCQTTMYLFESGTDLPASQLISNSPSMPACSSQLGILVAESLIQSWFLYAEAYIGVVGFRVSPRVFVVFQAPLNPEWKLVCGSGVHVLAEGIVRFFRNRLGSGTYLPVS